MVCCISTLLFIMPEEPETKTGIKINTRYAGRLISCAIGAAIAIGTALWFVDISSAPFLLASIGGTTVFLFCLTRAAAAQPRAVFWGAPGRGSHRCYLLPGLRGCYLGIHTFGSPNTALYACHKDGSPTGRCKPSDHGPRACQSLCSLAAGWLEHHHSGADRCCLEQAYPGNGSLPGEMVRQVTPFNLLGRLE